jgi:hypothetical protein
MKLKFTGPFFTLLLVAGLLGCFVAPFPPQPQLNSDGKDYHDIASFRETRLKDPNRAESIQSREFDLDGDGLPEKYLLNNGRITVLVGTHAIWRSPEDWWVDYFFLGDINNDGILELNLLVWKEGSFGPFKPFWVEEDTSVKNHLFIYRLEKDNFKPVWQSSNLARPNYWATLTDLNHDGENELIVIEGSYTDPGVRNVTIWKWNGWGFSRE